MTIISVRVIRPKDRTSAVLANVEMTLDNGVKLLNMRLLRPREGEEGNFLKMPSVTTKTGIVRSVYNPISSEVRAKMTAAANEALRQAEEAGVNDYTAVLQEQDSAGSQAPVLSNIQIHWFDNEQPIRAFASVLMDGEIALHRMAVVRNRDSQMLTVSIPQHPFRNTNRRVEYYQVRGKAYELLYKQIMHAYSERPDEDGEAVEEAAG